MRKRRNELLEEMVRSNDEEGLWTTSVRLGLSGQEETYAQGFLRSFSKRKTLKMIERNLI